MQGMHWMKGEGKTLITIESNTCFLEMVGYPDGSFGILRDGANVGTWEARERDFCMRALVEMAGYARETASCIFIRLANREGRSWN
jgi:hypothetical protein